MNKLFRRGILLVCFVILTGTLASCGLIRNAAEYGSAVTFSADQTVYMVCSADCRAQKQCGDLAENQTTVVFINNSGPSTQAHTGLLQQNTQVVVREAVDRQMVLKADNGQFSRLNWYKVGFQDVNNASNWTDGWVAGWCLANSIQ